MTSAALILSAAFLTLALAVAAGIAAGVRH